MEGAAAAKVGAARKVVARAAFRAIAAQAEVRAVARAA
jgi:hypothetical protein